MSLSAKLIVDCITGWHFNRDAFETYIETVLVRELRAGGLVIMENRSSHKVPRAQEMFEATGAELCYPPPCSQGFNPIENAFSEFKAPLRKVAEQAVEG